MKRPGGKRATKPKGKAKAKRTHYTAAENRSYQAWLKAHPFKNTGFPTTPAKPKPRGAPGHADSGYGWIGELNEEYPACVAVAVANSLLAVRGVRATDDQVMRLHHDSGAASDDGVNISDCLASVMQYGLAGFRPAGYWATDGPVQGDVLGASDGENDHAVTVTEHGLISWGAPLDGELAETWQFDGEAWHIQW